MLDPLVRSVLTMMARYGGDATMVVVNGEGTYDPETSTTTSNEKEYPIRVLAQDYIQKSNGLMAQAGGLIQTGDKQFFILPKDGMPAPRPEVDYVIFEGRKWTVKTLKDYNPSGTKSYLYEVFARK
jgi:hypothetical protein